MHHSLRLATVATVVTAAAGAVLGLGTVAQPASASFTPVRAVVGCSFNPLYATYENGVLSNLKQYETRNTPLLVDGGDSGAWHVLVQNGSGRSGWMRNDICVLFLE